MKKIRIALVFALCAVMLAFVACTPKIDSIKEKYQDEGYAVIDVKAGDLSRYGIESEKIESGLVATKITQTVVIVWFKDSADAKQTYNDVKSDDSKGNVIRKGNMVAIGSKEAIDIL